MGSKTSEKKKWARCNCVRKWKYSPSRYCLQASRVQTRVNQTRTQDQSCCTASLFLTEPSNRQANAFTTDFSKRPRRISPSLREGINCDVADERANLEAASLAARREPIVDLFDSFVEWTMIAGVKDDTTDREQWAFVSFFGLCKRNKVSRDSTFRIPPRSGVWKVYF